MYCAANSLDETSDYPNAKDASAPVGFCRNNKYKFGSYSRMCLLRFAQHRKALKGRLSVRGVIHELT